jgi:outer membrane protein assembly factor BamB
VTALDANNGTLLWTAGINGVATSLAANDAMVFASGAGLLRVLHRQERAEGQNAWQAGLPGTALGGVIVDSGRVLAVTEGGSIQVFDANTGTVGVADMQVGTLGGAAAVSAPYVFIPTQSGILYAVRSGN